MSIYDVQEGHDGPKVAQLSFMNKNDPFKSLQKYYGKHIKKVSRVTNQKM